LGNYRTMIKYLLTIIGACICLSSISCKKTNSSSSEVDPVSYEKAHDACLDGVYASVVSFGFIIDDHTRAWSKETKRKNSSIDLAINQSLLDQHDEIKEASLTLDSSEGLLSFNLAKPAIGYEAMHKKLLEIVVIAQEIEDLAKNPSGSLLSYSRETKAKVSEFTRAMREEKLMQPQK